MSAKLKASKAVPVNKACRKAVLENLATKAADMVKDSGVGSIKKIPTKKAPKACSIRLCCCFLWAFYFHFHCLQVLTAKEAQRKEFDKSMSELLGLACMLCINRISWTPLIQYNSPSKDFGPVFEGSKHRPAHDPLQNEATGGKYVLGICGFSTYIWAHTSFNKFKGQYPVSVILHAGHDCPPGWCAQDAAGDPHDAPWLYKNVHTCF